MGDPASKNNMGEVIEEDFQMSILALTCISMGEHTHTHAHTQLPYVNAAGMVLSSAKCVLVSLIENLYTTLV